MNWFKRRPDPDRVDPEAAIAQAEATKRRVLANQPFVNHVSNYTRNRKGQNGFGEDIEFTFRPKAGGATS